MTSGGCIWRFWRARLASAQVRNWSVRTVAKGVPIARGETCPSLVAAVIGGTKRRGNNREEPKAVSIEAIVLMNSLAI